MCTELRAIEVAKPRLNIQTLFYCSCMCVQSHPYFPNGTGPD